MQDDRVASLIRQGQDAAQRGNSGLAREYLQAAVDLAPNNATAWLWLAGVLNEPEEARYALERVLELEPGNLRAEQGLMQLQARTGVKPPPSVVDEPGQPRRGTSALGGMTGPLSIEQELRAALRTDPPASPAPGAPLALPGPASIGNSSAATATSRRALFGDGDDLGFRVAVIALTILLVVGLLLLIWTLVTL